MSLNSAIQWTDAMWNPTTGCTRVSPGCDHCYIERTPPFRMQGRRFDREGVGATTGVQLHPERLDQPLKWRKPRRVFVNSMSDLFHPQVPSEFIAQVFAVMGSTPKHTYQVLTKRPARMRSMLDGEGFRRSVQLAWLRHVDSDFLSPSWPLPNVWLGTSVEDQERADQRIPLLLATPAAVRFISAEPLLGPMDVSAFVEEWWEGAPRPEGIRRGPRVSWVIVGGESGPGARPMHPHWARSLVEQCKQAGVACFVKQMGAWREAGPDDATHLVHVGGPARKAAYVVEREKATTIRRYGHQGQYERHDDLVDRGHPGWVRMRRVGGDGGREHEIPADLRVREYPLQTPAVTS